MSATVPDLLAARAELDPRRSAVEIVGGGALTFGQWWSHAQRFAAWAAARGVRAGDRVVLSYAEEDWDAYAVAFLGVLLAGGVAVPVSSRLPEARLKQIVEDCDASLTAAVGDVVDARAGSGSGSGPGSGPGLSSERSWPQPDPASPAQILYTSGTTGTPRGVIATHANLAAGLRTRPRPLAHSRYFLHSFPIGSNAAQTVLLTSIVAAPTMLVLPRFTAGACGAVIAERAVGTVFLVPAMAAELVAENIAEHFDTDGVVLLGSTAAALAPSLAQALTAQFPNAAVVNTYTSTEAAPAQATMVFDPTRPGSVGRPEAGSVRVTDDAGRPVPTGGIGDVWLRTGSLTRSYHGDPGASASVFADGWTRMGDVGRLDGDGYLHLVDREKDLIVSGALKISTLAVEAALLSHPDVREAAVVGVAHPVMGQMAAAVVVVRGLPDLAGIRRHLAERLPRHEVPTRFAVVERIPRNELGKPVKTELRDLFAGQDADGEAECEAAAAGTAGEGNAGTTAPTAPAALAALWARVLRRPAVPGDADFFACGGDSLRATQLSVSIGAELGVVVPMTFAYDHPTLPLQKSALAALAGSVAAPAGAGEGSGISASGLLPTTEHFLGWMSEAPGRYPEPVSATLRIRGRLDPDAVRMALRSLTRRHESLRTVLLPGSFEPFVLTESEPEIRWTRCPAGDVEAQAVAILENPFDSHAGPPLRVHVMETGTDDQVLVLALDHLVADGWSLGIVLREFGLCYDAYRRGTEPRLAPPTTSVADYTAWIRGQYERTVPLWEEHLAGASVDFLLPGQRPDAAGCTGAVHHADLPPEVGQAWRAAAAAHATSPFAIGLAAWTATVTELADLPEAVFLTPMAGRLTPESEQLVGDFALAPFLRIRHRPGTSMEALIAACRQEIAFDLENQCFPYERFRAALPTIGSYGYEKWGHQLHIPGLDSEPFPLPIARMLRSVSPPGEPDRTPIIFRVFERADGGLTVRMQYNAEAFAAEAIESIERSFRDKVLEIL